MKKVYVFLAEGFETIEALTPVDVMHRSGVEVATVSISDSKRVTSSHGVVVEADMLLADNDLNDGDAIVLPGGFPGYVNLGESEAVGEVVQNYCAKGKYVAAICGAPTVLAVNKVFEGSRITCHASVRERMDGYEYTGRPTEIDGKLITGRGAGVSVEFSLQLARLLTDEKTVETVSRKMEL